MPAPQDPVRMPGGKQLAPKPRAREARVDARTIEQV